MVNRPGGGGNSARSPGGGIVNRPGGVGILAQPATDLRGGGRSGPATIALVGPIAQARRWRGTLAWHNRPGGAGGGEPWPGNNNRPGWANRPGGAGGGEPWPGNNNRPGWANRPGGAGGGEPWPGDNNRPGWANRPNWSNQTKNLVNRPVNINNQNFSQVNNSLNANRAWGYNRYQGNYAGWHTGNWNNWNACPAAWYGAGGH